jgi:hypothetical protein
MPGAGLGELESDPPESSFPGSEVPSRIGIWGQKCLGQGQCAGSCTRCARSGSRPGAALTAHPELSSKGLRGLTRVYFRASVSGRQWKLASFRVRDERVTSGSEATKGVAAKLRFAGSRILPGVPEFFSALALPRVLTSAKPSRLGSKTTVLGEAAFRSAKTVAAPCSARPDSCLLLPAA